jgi:hypothetical protein
MVDAETAERAERVVADCGSRSRRPSIPETDTRESAHARSTEENDTPVRISPQTETSQNPGGSGFRKGRAR